MKPLLLLVVAVVMLPFPALAQSEEGKAFAAYIECVKRDALTLAVLDQPLSDIAEAAQASCFGPLTDFNKAVVENVTETQRPAMMEHAKEAGRREAVIVVAKEKFKAQARK